MIDFNNCAKVFILFTLSLCMTRAQNAIVKDFDVKKALGTWFIYNAEMSRTCPVIQLTQGSGDSGVVIEYRRYKSTDTNSTEYATEEVLSLDVKDGRLYLQNLDPNNTSSIHGLIEATDYVTYLILRRFDKKKIIMIRKPELNDEEEQKLISTLKQIDQSYIEEYRRVEPDVADLLAPAKADGPAGAAAGSPPPSKGYQLCDNNIMGSAVALQFLTLLNMFVR